MLKWLASKMYVCSDAHMFIFSHAWMHTCSHAHLLTSLDVYMLACSHAHISRCFRVYMLRHLVLTYLDVCMLTCSHAPMLAWLDVYMLIHSFDLHKIDCLSHYPFSAFYFILTRMTCRRTLGLRGIRVFT